MKLETQLRERSQNKCELCGTTSELSPFAVSPAENDEVDYHVLLCNTCKEQIENPESIDLNHWRCLNESAWSSVPSVQVVGYRMLHHLRAEGWAQNLLDVLYLEEEVLAWAKAGMELSEQNVIKHFDSNGAILQAGDSVVLIKDLNVKGASFTAKRGTAVRNITLDQDNAEFIEGKVNGQQIVILTKYVKKN